MFKTYNNNKGCSMNLESAFQVCVEGIKEYLYKQSRQYNHRGRLWITPHGPFNTLNDVEIFTGAYRKTLLRRFYSPNKKFYDWYIIDPDSELFPAETCAYCDEIDNMIFLEDQYNWLHRVHHIHNEPLNNSTKFEYLHKGKMYCTSVQDWKNGLRLHKQEEDNSNECNN